MQPAKWPSLVFRAFGVASLLFASSGVLFTICDVKFFGMHVMNSYPGAPYMVPAFWTMIAMNLVFEIALAIAGIRLWQLRKQGLTICNALFPAEILYFLALSMPRFPGVSEGLRLSITFAGYIANTGSALQWITGFPLIALVALNLVRRRLDFPCVAAPPLVAQG
jgi:hypothetical protein